jgi:hypothetical protein
MDFMVNMMKGMDNATIKNMMKMQGMELTDDQIAMMKNNMNPNTLKYMKQNPDLIDKARVNNTGVTNTSTPVNNTQTTTLSNEMPQMPSMNGMPNLNNMDMGSMLSFVQSNPQLLNMMAPQMSQMFGKNIDPNTTMKAMESIIWILSGFQRVKSFFGSTQGRLLILAFIILIIAYFYR